MDPAILLGVILAAPLIALMILRVNAALVFLSLCLGSVLVQFVGPDATTILSSFQAANRLDQTYINLGLQLLPVILTTLIMIHSVKGRGKLFLNVFPAAGVAALLALLVVPLVPASGIVGTPIWNSLQNLQTLIVGSSALLALLFLWLQRPKRRSEEPAK